MEGRKTRGRQKIEMKKIEKEEDRLIAFSKRRAGIIKKASELVTLCGVEVGFLVFSTAGKPYSFGHPSFESIASRFLNEIPPPQDNIHSLIRAHQTVRINNLNQLQNELSDRLDAEKGRWKALQQTNKGKQDSQDWWETPVEELNADQLLTMNGYLQELHQSVWKKINERTSEASSSLVASLSESRAPKPPPCP